MTPCVSKILHGCGLRWPSRQSVSSGPKGPGSRLAWRNTVMYAIGTCVIQNPSWAQCPPIPNQITVGTTAGEPFPPWRIKIVLACFRIILRDETQTVDNSPLRSTSSTLNPTNEPFVDEMSSKFSS